MLAMLLLSLPVMAQELTRDVDFQTETNVVTENAANSAAMIAAQICQRGVSGQITEGGFSIVNPEALCDWIRISDVMLAASNLHKGLGNEEYAEMYMGYHHNALHEANSLVTKTSYATYLERLFSALLLPLGIVAGLVFLL